MVIGSRLLEDEAIAGGMPRWKWVGNRFLTGDREPRLPAAASPSTTPATAPSRAEILRAIAFLRNSDGFVFDQEIFAQVVTPRARVEEIAIPTRYFLEASSVSFRDSVDYGLRDAQDPRALPPPPAGRPLDPDRAACGAASGEERRAGRTDRGPRGRRASPPLPDS